MSLEEEPNEISVSEDILHPESFPFSWLLYKPYSVVEGHGNSEDVPLSYTRERDTETERLISVIFV